MEKRTHHLSLQEAQLEEKWTKWTILKTVTTGNEIGTLTAEIEPLIYLFLYLPLMPHTKEKQLSVPLGG